MPTNMMHKCENGMLDDLPINEKFLDYFVDGNYYYPQEFEVRDDGNELTIVPLGNVNLKRESLTVNQINLVVNWMNELEQLKDTCIPVRFKKHFIKLLQ